MSEHGYRGVYQTLDDAWFDDVLEESQVFLIALDNDPSELKNWLEASSTRLLGIRFESMLAFFFKNHPRFQVLAKNVQLEAGGQTLGEIDFIIKDLTQGKVLHIEAACKFYLSSKNSPQWGCWVGPNPHDTLKLKMDKLVDQLAVTKTEQGKRFLDDERISHPEPTLLMKGSFHHHYSNLAMAKRPKFSNPCYNSGWWCHQRELNELDNPHLLWAKLDKKSWLCPQIIGHQETLDFIEIQNSVSLHFSENKRSLLLICLIQEDGLWIEHSRGFIVNNSWPD